MGDQQTESIQKKKTKGPVTNSVTALMNSFWRECERNNFSKDASLLYLHLAYLHGNEPQGTEIFLHPASLMCKVINFQPKDVEAAAKELEERGIVTYTAPSEKRTSGVYVITTKMF